MRCLARWMTLWSLLGMIKEPIFQAWLYGEPLDAVRLVHALLPLVVGGVKFQVNPGQPAA